MSWNGDAATRSEAITHLVTIGDWLRYTASSFDAAEVFYGHGTDNAWDEAVHLVLPLLYLPVSTSATVMNAKLLPSERERLFDALALRIEQQVPVPYITQQAWFCNLPFYVDERVLIPRSPFGELINLRFSRWLKQEPTRIADVGTGSGCIAIALAEVFRDAEVDALDISSDALEVAEYNIAQHQLSDRVFPLYSDVFAGVGDAKYDLIVANPPYVDAEDMASLPAEFNHEPVMALAAGDDGLDIVRTIIKTAAAHLTAQGWLFVEVGNSEVHIREQWPDMPLQWVDFHHGGSGVFVMSREQVVVAAKQLG